MKYSKLNVQTLDLTDLFKIFTNQSRLEILVLLKDNCSTLNEMAEKLSMDKSTIYRHLRYLKNRSLIISYEKDKVERYDLSCTLVYDLIESGINILSNLKDIKTYTYNNLKIFSNEIKNIEEIKVDKFIDLCGEVCPVPDVTARKEIKKLKKGHVLLVIIDYPLSKERIPKIIENDGNEVLAIVDDSLSTKIYIRRK